MSISGLIGGIGSIVGGTIGAIGSSSAANAQKNAAGQAITNEQGYSQAALNAQNAATSANIGNESPFLQAGQGAATTLGGLMSTPGQGLLQNWDQSFQAPTAAQAAATPGYQFQLQQGEQALQNSAAARGGLLSGGTMKAMDQYSQGLAGTNYQQTYNNAFQNYLQNYQQFQNNQSNQYNRLMGVAGMGQTSAGELGQLGQAGAQNTGNINMGAGQQIGAYLTNQGNAQASGYAGMANNMIGGLGGAENNLQQTMMLQNLMGAGNYGYTPGSISGY